LGKLVLIAIVNKMLKSKLGLRNNTER